MTGVADEDNPDAGADGAGFCTEGIERASPRKRQQRRNGTIDLLRFIGAAAIVWFHMRMPFSDLALTALPLFVMLSVIYGAGRPIRERARRYLEPWYIWSGIYAAAKVLEIAAGGSSFQQEFHPWMLVAGPALHLWFLPFMVAVFVVLKIVESQFLLWLSAVVAWLAFDQLMLPIPVAQWASVWPAAVVAATSQFGLGAALLSMAVLSPFPAGAIQCLLALGIVAAGLRIRLPPYRWTRLLGGLSLGVYLAHPLVASVFHRLFDVVSYPAVLGLSVALTLLLKVVLPRSV